MIADKGKNSFNLQTNDTITHYTLHINIKSKSTIHHDLAAHPPTDETKPLRIREVTPSLLNTKG